VTITGKTITDDQIRKLLADVTAELHAAGWPPSTGYDEHTKRTYWQAQCRVALGEKRASRGSSRALARLRCAAVWNERAAKACQMIKPHHPDCTCALCKSSDDERCTNVATGTHERSVRVCDSCGQALEREGFVIQWDTTKAGGQ
jgi:hypothetical protein